MICARIGSILILFVLLAAAQWPQLVAESDHLDLLLLHTNDIHARYEQADVYGNTCTEQLAKLQKCYGGFARLKKALDHFRSEAAERNLSSLFVNAGDTFQGTPYHSLFGWKIAVKLLPMLGIDVMGLGNHELNAGNDELIQLVKNYRLPIVATNMNFSRDSEFQKLPNLVRSKIITINGTKVGFVGYVLHHNSGATQITITDEIAALQQETKRLKEEQQVNVIIALGHAGFERDIKIAKAVPDISLIVGGHSHTFLYTPVDEVPSTDTADAEYPYMVVQHSGRRTAIVQAASNGKYLGRLLIKFDRDGNVLSASGHPVLLNSSFEEDEYVLKNVMKFKSGLGSSFNRLVGKSNTLLSADLTLDIPESNFGNLMADAFVHYGAEQFTGKTGWTDAPIAIMLAASIRAAIDRKDDLGIITHWDLLASLPMQNYLIELTVNGSMLISALEHSLATIHRKFGFYMPNYVSVAGLKIIADASKEPGKRIESIRARCGTCKTPYYADVDVAKNYTLITTVHLAHGGNGFNMLRNATRSRRLLEITCRTSVEQYIQLQQVVYPGVDERIVIRNLKASSKSSASSSLSRSNLTSNMTLFFVSFSLYFLYCSQIASNF